MNPIGCGDCLAGAFACALARGSDVISALRLGMGAAAQNAGAVLTARLDMETTTRLAAEVREV